MSSMYVDGWLRIASTLSSWASRSSTGTSLIRPALVRLVPSVIILQLQNRLVAVHHDNLNFVLKRF